MNATDLVERHLADATSAWSIGSYGAVGEFFRGADEAASFEVAAGGHAVVTPRGALFIHLGDGLRVVAYQIPSRRGDGWTQGVAFCLPRATAAVPARDALTEIGPDAGALRPGDRDGILFDLGLALPHVEACVRTADPGLVDRLRRHVGRRVLEPGNPVVARLKEASPHRIFQSRLGRLEVYQPIPSGGEGARTPEGPHTHLLPHLLAGGRTHGPETPVPAGYLPCLTLHPASPITDDLGRAMPFDAARHTAFEALLAAFGERVFTREKERVRRALRSGMAPARYAPLTGASARAAVRVALREVHHVDPHAAGLDAWRAAFDAAAPGAPDAHHRARTAT